jgi:hypothetical protein
VGILGCGYGYSKVPMLQVWVQIRSKVPVGYPCSSLKISLIILFNSQDPLKFFLTDHSFLAATSVHPECSFSKGSDMVSRFRHNLSKNSVCAGTVLSSYVDKGFVPKAKVLDMFKSRGTRWRDNGKKIEIVEVSDNDSDDEPD